MHGFSAFQCAYNTMQCIHRGTPTRLKTTSSNSTSIDILVSADHSDVQQQLYCTYIATKALLYILPGRKRQN